MDARTDASLLRLARAGDAAAYEAIVARYREPLRRSCARITPDRAEDAVQQALLAAWMALERGADVRELRPWLYAIARNAAIDQARGVRSDLVELGPEIPGGEDPAQAEARRRELTEVLEAVAALPERQRRALVATALHGRTTEAVAVDLGLSGGALRQLVHRARTSVRAAVPSVAFPMPAWLAELFGEEGVRRGAVLLSSGSGAAVVAKTTATVATVSAVALGGMSVDGSAVRAAPDEPAVRTVRSNESSGVTSPTIQPVAVALSRGPSVITTRLADTAAGNATTRESDAAEAPAPAEAQVRRRHAAASNVDGATTDDGGHVRAPQTGSAVDRSARPDRAVDRWERRDDARESQHAPDAERAEAIGGQDPAGADRRPQSGRDPSGDSDSMSPSEVPPTAPTVDTPPTVSSQPPGGGRRDISDGGPSSE